MSEEPGVNDERAREEIAGRVCCTDSCAQTLMIMNAFASLLGFVLSLFGFGRARGWRPSFPVHQDFVQGQLSAGTIYRLLRDREDSALPA